jgi:hypothetical protein
VGVVPRLTRIRSVDLNPPTLPTRLLGKDVHDAFLKQSTGVCELYSWHLADAEPVPAQTSWVRFVPVTDAAEADGGIAADPARSSDGEGEVCIVLMDDALPALPPEERPRAYLDWLQEQLLHLAAIRGWPVRGFEESYERCIADGCRFRWTGSARTSPDRRLKAVPEYEIDPDGDGWLRLAVDGPGIPTAVTGGPWDCLPAYGYMRRSAKSLRWADAGAVSIESFPADLAHAWGLAAEHEVRVR